MADPVLICGGGIGGLSAAIALAREGIPVTVLEQMQSFSEAGAGIEIGPNASCHLEAWGVMELITSFASEPDCMRLYDGLNGELLTTVPLGKFITGRYGAPYLAVHRKHLQYCLLEIAGGLDGLTIETGFTVNKVEQRNDGVTVSSINGDQRRGRALIGADGLWSTVRATFTDQEPQTVGVTAWRALLPMSEVPDPMGGPDIAVHLGPYGHVLHYPLEAGATFCIVAMIEETINFDGWASPGKSADLLPYFESWSEQLYDLLERADDWHKWTVMTMQPLADWGRGAVTLVGDAAHPIEPFMAQGGAAAIEDAACLARAVVDNRDDIASAFRAYEAARQPRITRVQKASHQRGRIYHMSGVMRWARDRMLRNQAPETLVTRYDWLFGETG